MRFAKYLGAAVLMFALGAGSANATLITLNESFSASGFGAIRYSGLSHSLSTTRQISRTVRRLQRQSIYPLRER